VSEPRTELVRCLLWTLVAATTADNALHVVCKYTCRWPIEAVKYVLKSSSRAEDFWLETWDALENAGVTTQFSRMIVLVYIRKCMTMWRWAVVVMLLAASSVSGVMFWRGRPERHLARAERAVRDGDPFEALSWLTVPESSPGTRERALLLRARIAVERGELAESVRALDQVDPAGPNAFDYAFWRGRTLYAAKQPLLAITWLVAARNCRPGHADSHRWLAAAAYDQGNRATAVSAIEAVTRLEPDDGRAWRTLGMMFKEDVQYEQARAAFERSLAIDGSQAAIRLELGEVLVKLGDVAGAERELSACRGRVPEARHAELMADCARTRGDLAGFRAAVESGLAAAPDHPGLLLQRAQIDVELGHPVDALVHLDRAASADPYRPETIYQRGRLLHQLGRTEEARRQLARADELTKGLAEMSDLNRQAERAPHDAEVRYRLGRLCVELGKPELGASWYRAALACDPGHNDARLGLRALGPTVRASGPPRS
jgi:tetratricopeptide (TPR) repeat protein